MPEVIEGEGGTPVDVLSPEERAAYDAARLIREVSGLPPLSIDEFLAIGRTTPPGEPFVDTAIPEGTPTVTTPGPLAEAAIGTPGIDFTPDVITALAHDPGSSDIAMETYRAVLAAQIAAAEQAASQPGGGGIGYEEGTIADLLAAEHDLADRLATAGQLTVPNNPNPAAVEGARSSALQSFDRAMQVVTGELEGRGRHDAASAALARAAELRAQYAADFDVMDLGGALVPAQSPLSFLQGRLSPLLALETIKRRGSSRPSRGLIKKNDDEDTFLGAGRLING